MKMEEEITDIINGIQIQWFGYVQIMNNKRLPKQVRMTAVQNKEWVFSRMDWLKNIIQGVTSKGIKESDWLHRTH